MARQPFTATDPEVQWYLAPGCGAFAEIACELPNYCLEFCEAPNQPSRTDNTAIGCGCDGTTMETQCCLFDKPFRYWGACTDGGRDAAAGGSGGPGFDASAD